MPPPHLPYDWATTVPTMFSVVLPHDSSRPDALILLASERGELVIPMSSRAVVRQRVGEYSIDTDHLHAQYDARDRFDRDAGWGIT